MAKKSFKNISPSGSTSGDSISEFDKKVYGLDKEPSPEPQQLSTKEAQPKIIPFSTSIRQDLFLRIKQLEYWGSETEGRKNINEMVDEALETYLKNYPNANKSLPEKAYQKLIQSKKFKG